MAKISDLSDELLVKILSFLPTKVAVSTSILSKQWEFLWMWSPNLEFDCIDDSVRDFIDKNLPLHRAPIINSLRLNFHNYILQAETLKSWVEIALSRGVRELSIISELKITTYVKFEQAEFFFLPSSLYTCNSLVTLELRGIMILVDVPQTVCLPSLKTLQLTDVTYSKEDTHRVLLSNCSVLEDLTIHLNWEENVRLLVIIIPSLQRLSLNVEGESPSDGSVISTPSLKYFKLVDYRNHVSPHLIEHMPELEEADIDLIQDIEIDIDKLLKSITTVKRLTVRVTLNNGNETLYGDGIFFSQLENLKLYICSENWSKILFQLLKDFPNLQILDHEVDDTVYGGGIIFSRLENLKLYICSENWSKILFQLLKDSPNLQILDLEVDDLQPFEDYKRVRWSNKKSSVPKCLLKSLKTFKFERYSGEREQRDFLSFIFRHARCLKSTSICAGDIMKHN